MEIEFTSVLIAFGLTVFAGLATGIGSALAFFAKRTNTKLLTASLGFSAGVMIYISFVELLAEAVDSLKDIKHGNWVAVGAFFGGMLLIAIVDKLVPNIENPHELHKVEDMDDEGKAKRYKKLYRMGMFTALAIAIHNFPEGMATFVGGLKNLSIGIPIAIAVAIHNIPEGIAVSIPIYFATGDKKKAFVHSFLSGLAEPLGALVGYLLLMPFLSDTVFGILFAAVAGIMVFISLDELLPSAEEFGHHHHSIYGLVVGMMVMAISLLLLK